MTKRLAATVMTAVLLAAVPPASSESPVCISGIYPHLAVFNSGGKECGIGAVVPWARRLWLITYPPHDTRGGPDKLWSIDAAGSLKAHPKSVGGTHAGRMIHRESNQLIIGPYFIDAAGRVRAADVKTKLIGRMTAVARHLKDPKNLVYMYDMEGAVYEVNVRTLAVKKLFARPVPGDHGKGGYTGQGRLIIANNGERRPRKRGQYGVLAEWDGDRWRIVERKRFCDVTGPGGIYGSPDETSAVWAVGWDRRSVILKLLDARKWYTFRMPKASHTFDPIHGWYTEWPRIRRIAPDRLMMDMHGMFYDFPKGFCAADTGGIVPIASHLRYIPDFCEWNGRVVLAADDTSVMSNRLAGQSQSNLWFGKVSDLAGFGPRSGWGGVWMGDPVRADKPSDPFLIGGFARRVIHLAVGAKAGDVTFTLEIDVKGDGNWKAWKQITVPAGGYRYHVFAGGLKANWIRIRADRDCLATAYFHYASPAPAFEADGKLFASLAKASGRGAPVRGLVRPAAHNTNLQFVTRDGAYFEIDEKMNFRIPAEPRTDEVEKVARIKRDLRLDAASVIFTHKGRRYRLPRGDVAYDKLTARGIRECVSERFLVNARGTFYELPRDSGGHHPGIELIKPVCTHGRAVADFCTWRGLMVISGTVRGARPDGNYFASADGKAGLWFGHIDDLWQLGKPTGRGGPWKNTEVRRGKPSDPYLMTGYDRKRVELSHDAKAEVEFAIEVNFDHDGWHGYAKLSAGEGKTVAHVFPRGYNAHWVRVKSNKPCRATATFVYE